MKTLRLLGPVLIFTVSLVSTAKEIDIQIPAQEVESIKFIAKEGTFSVSGWNKDFVKIYGEANQDVIIDTENPNLVLTLNSTVSLAVQDQLTINVPSDKSINVVSNNADFSFDGLSGRLNSSTESGNIQIENFNSDLSVKSVDGNVSVNKSSGDFNIDTVNGDIAILDSSGVANVKSVSGNQNVEADLRIISSSNASGQSVFKLKTLEKLNLNNVNGDSTVDSAISKGANVQMKSVKGDLNLLVPATTSAKFSLQSHQGGTISNVLGGEIDNANSGDKTLNFSLADSSGSVTMNTMEGNIEVAPQDANPVDFSAEDFDWSSVDTSILDFAYISPNHNYRDYNGFYIKEPEIHFDPRWIEKFGDAKTKTYRERIVRDYSELLEKALADKFSKGTALNIVDQRSDNVLVIIPKVLELYIDNPETVGIRESFVTTSAGNAKIDLVIYSPREESILSLIMDKRSTITPGIASASNPRTVNTRAFSRHFNDWAEDIVAVLNK